MPGGKVTLGCLGGVKFTDEYNPANKKHPIYKKPRRIRNGSKITKKYESPEKAEPPTRQGRTTFKARQNHLQGKTEPITRENRRTKGREKAEYGVNFSCDRIYFNIWFRETVAHLSYYFRFWCTFIFLAISTNFPSPVACHYAMRSTEFRLEYLPNLYSWIRCTYFQYLPPLYLLFA